MTPDPLLLSDGERRVLALLAEGHTAKTIATETGLSVNAVNERLREARRKTGVGSSRELARLLRLQENRDEKIEVPGVDATGTEPSVDAAAIWPGGGTKGLVLMATLVIIGAAGLMLLVGRPQLSSSDRVTVPIEPRVERFLTPEESAPRRLYQRVRSERRDAGWADPAQAWVRTRLTSVPQVEKLEVRCGSSLCEAIGDIRPGPVLDDGAPVAAVRNDPLIVLQRIALESNEALKVKPASFSVGAGPNKIGSTFIAYWRRDGAPAA